VCRINAEGLGDKDFSSICSCLTDTPPFLAPLTLLLSAPCCDVLCRAVLYLCRINAEGLGDKDFSSIYRYIYGAGCNNSEWKEGQQLFSSQTP
jgi:hypothetical protein